MTKKEMLVELSETLGEGSKILVHHCVSVRRNTFGNDIFELKLMGLEKSKKWGGFHKARIWMSEDGIVCLTPSKIIKNGYEVIKACPNKNK